THRFAYLRRALPPTFGASTRFEPRLRQPGRDRASRRWTLRIALLDTERAGARLEQRRDRHFTAIGLITPYPANRGGSRPLASAAPGDRCARRRPASAQVQLGPGSPCAGPCPAFR